MSQGQAQIQVGEAVAGVDLESSPGVRHCLIEGATEPADLAGHRVRDQRQWIELDGDLHLLDRFRGTPQGRQQEGVDQSRFRGVRSELESAFQLSLGGIELPLEKEADRTDSGMSHSQVGIGLERTISLRSCLSEQGSRRCEAQCRNRATSERQSGVRRSVIRIGSSCSFEESQAALEALGISLLIEVSSFQIRLMSLAVGLVLRSPGPSRAGPGSADVLQDRVSDLLLKVDPSVGWSLVGPAPQRAIRASVDQASGDSPVIVEHEH